MILEYYVVIIKNPKIQDFQRDARLSFGLLDFWISGFLGFWIFGFLDFLDFWILASINGYYLLNIFHTCIRTFNFFIKNIYRQAYIYIVLICSTNLYNPKIQKSPNPKIQNSVWYLSENLGFLDF